MGGKEEYQHEWTQGRFVGVGPRDNPESSVIREFCVSQIPNDYYTRVL